MKTFLLAISLAFSILSFSQVKPSKNGQPPTAMVSILFPYPLANIG